MIQKLNRLLRTLFIVCEALSLLCTLLPKTIVQSNKESLDNEDFDDIW